MAEHSIQHLVEVALYVDDLERADAFYRDVLGLELIGKEPGRHVFFRAGEGVLLIFIPEATQQSGLFPAHGAKGPGHAALGIVAESLDFWRSRLHERGVQIEKGATWPLGGRSLYFRDPAGNSIELITPHCWGLPSGALVRRFLGCRPPIVTPISRGVYANLQ
jgi:catechol 2,3-dioxygenase-like lactoylglutathione lyase family enzyme